MGEARGVDCAAIQLVRTTHCGRFQATKEVGSQAGMASESRATGKSREDWLVASQTIKAADEVWVVTLDLLIPISGS